MTHAIEVSDVTKRYGSLQALEADSALLTPRQRYSLALLHGGLALQSDDPDAIDAIRSRLHDIPADVGDAALVGRNHILAWMHAFGGEYASAMRLLNESARHEAGPGRRIIRMCLEAMCRAIEGRMAEAEAPRATNTVENPKTKASEASTTRRFVPWSRPSWPIRSSRLAPAMKQR